MGIIEASCPPPPPPPRLRRVRHGVEGSRCANCGDGRGQAEEAGAGARRGEQAARRSTWAQAQPSSFSTYTCAAPHAQKGGWGGGKKVNRSAGSPYLLLAWTRIRRWAAVPLLEAVVCRAGWNDLPACRDGIREGAGSDWRGARQCGRRRSETGLAREDHIGANSMFRPAVRPCLRIRGSGGCSGARL